MFWQILVWVLVVLSVLRWQRRKKIQCCYQFKCDFISLPFVGLGYLLLGNGEDKSKVFQAFGREALKQGGLTSLHCWIFNQFFTVVADAEVAELILKKCLEKDDSMKLFQRFFRESLAVVSVPCWRPRRKTMNHSFALKHLNQLVEIFKRKSSILAEKLKACGDEPFSIYRYISAHSFDVVSESTFGIEANAQNSSEIPELKALNKTCCLIGNRMAQPLYHNQQIYEMTPQYAQLKGAADVIWKYVDKNIKQKYEEFIKCKNDSHSMETNDQNEAANTTPKPILQLMVEGAHEKLSEDYLRQEAVVLLFAGTDTTSVVFSFTCLMLAKYPEVQEKVYQEIQEVFGDSEKTIETEDLLVPKLKYTEAVIKETMRVHPPGPLLLRKLDKDLVLPSGRVLVKGTGAMINLWALHRNPAYWGDDAEQFRPERFFDSPPKHPAAFIPFSYGPRNCIAYQFAMMSMKTSLAAVVNRYQVIPASNEDIGKLYKREEMRTTFDILNRDVENYPIRLRPRHQ